MLMANMAVAGKIAAGLPEQALLRRHEPPIDRRLVRTSACIRARSVLSCVAVLTGCFPEKDGSTWSKAGRRQRWCTHELDQECR